MTASGSDQRSYCAARMRNTMMMPNAMAITDVKPVRFSWKA